MGGLMGKPPAQPSAEEQFAIQKRLQEQAETEATEKAETARRKAMLEEQRKQARRRSGSSLVSRRDTGLLGTVDIESAGTGGNYESLYESDS